MMFYKHELYIWTIDIWDLLLFPVYMILVLLIANAIKKRKIETAPEYRYFIGGLMMKIVGGVILTLIYIFYYGGGDTCAYFGDSVILSKMLFQNPSHFWAILMHPFSWDNYSFFTTETGYPETYRWANAFFVARLTTPLAILSFNSFFVTIILLSVVTYTGIWKLYQLFCELYPKYYQSLALPLLFIPSVFFWGSGVLKDSFTLAAIGWYTWCFYQAFMKRKKMLLNILIIVICIWLMIKLKPYVLVAIFPGSIIWFFYNSIQKMQNRVMKIFIGPVIIVLSFFIATFGISLFGKNLGKYGSLDAIIKTAQITQQDLTRAEAYGNNYFDIGYFDNSVSGILSKAPKAIVAGLFRPFIWESNNIVMLISGLENLLLTIISIYILFRVGIIKTISNITKEPLLFFSLLFVIIFVFAVGLTTANFGALVRYRIPALPFYGGILFVLLNKLKDSINQADNTEETLISQPELKIPS